MSEDVEKKCFICTTHHRVCGETKGRSLGTKARQTLSSVASSRKDDLIQLPLSTPSPVWVADACYKRYTDPRSVPITNENAIPQQNQSFERRTRSSPFGFKTHCLICEEELDFERAAKRPDIARYQISEVSTIYTQAKKSGKCMLQETLRDTVSQRSDPLAVEVAAKVSYASCIRAEEAKYHRDCMQRFLSGRTVTGPKFTHQHIHHEKHDAFNSFCDWYESTHHENTSTFTLFEVQHHIEKKINDEVYSIRHLSRKLSERYGAEGSEVRVTKRPGLSKIMLLQEEADEIVTGTVMDSSVEAAAKEIHYAQM